MVALFAKAQDNRNLAVTMANQATSEKRVMRGGLWSNDAKGLRAAKRNDNFPDYRGSYRGFRVARTLP